MRTVTVAATQMACSWDIEDNLARAEAHVREAARRGAGIVLLQELFETPYFCIEEHARHFALARPLGGNPLVERFSSLARELGVVLPLSFFEAAGNTRFNSLVVIDADGSIVSHYRKSHIPHNPGYEEKYYFSPGDTGFGVAHTRFGTLGIGICWDQWFPETARSLALLGAEILLFPTAIGSEPTDPTLDSSGHWRRVMQGHAGANIMPLVASNRVGTEREGRTEVTFYGTSFIADHTGAVVADLDRAEEGVALATFDLEDIARYRVEWGVFRDRRPDLYAPLATMDGRRRHPSA
ncbi:MAG: N-carbamoylputrescine amidase [Rhizobiales bacterium]|nr:N-carbamoylputrescine amidase [Hyphomicrobiales bacterium]